MLQYLREKGEQPRNYVSLDEFGPRTLANEDPELFLERFQAPLVIDEIQYAPVLLERIKVLVDRRREPGLYWLTGSQHFPLMQGVSESLAGRVAIIKLLGLSQEEEFQFPERPLPFRPDRVLTCQPRPAMGASSIFQRITRGTFPIFLHENAPPIHTFYGSYLQTYIERDVRSMANISKLMAFERFLKLAAARIGQLLNLSELARDAEISVSTAREWLNILEAGFQVLLLRPYFRNISKRQIKTPKLYFLDTGLACYLTGWRSPEVAMEGAMAGSLFENYVVTEIIKSYWYRGLEPSIWFWRTKEKTEVDLLLEEDGRLFPIEIKLTMRPQKKMVKGIEAIRRRIPAMGQGCIICPAEQRYPLTRDIEVVPVGEL